MASLLSAILTPEELDSLSSVLKEKISDCLSKKEADLSKTKIQYAKFQSESDQKFYDLDAELKRFREQNQKESDEKNELVKQKSDIESKFNEINEELLTLQQKIALLEEANSGLKRDKETLMTERDDFVSLLSRKNDDVDRLTTELKSLTDQLMNANREKSEVMIKTEELSSKQLALDYKEKRLDQERDLMSKQYKMLQDELDAKTKEIITLRREKTSKVLDLQADLSEKIEELKMSQRSVEEMRATVEQQEKQIKELTGKVKDLNEAEHKMSENARHELRSQVRLCELYKASSEDAQCKADELSKAVEELQRLLRDASVRYGELETDTKSEVDALKEQLRKRDEAIDAMKSELDRANGLLDTSRSRLLNEESIEAMSPSAAAASRLLKSGMTLTQIYSQYVTVSEQLLVKEEENKKLNNYIDQILQEIEERAPIISRQREDYEKSIEMVSSLTRQLDMAVEEAETEKCDALEARRLLGQSQRTSQRLEKQVTDLSKQVAFLLREVEELRGNAMADGPAGEQNVVSSSEDGSAGAIISRHLVTFKDVEELQHRNQMLLNTLREVTEKQEDAEREVLTEKTAKIEQALEKALVEVESMREARRRQEELVQSIVQQRDMYRMMVQEAGFNVSRSPSKFASAGVTSTPAAGAERSFDSTELNEYKVRLEAAEANCKLLASEKKELERSLSDRIQKLDDSVADLRARNVRLGTQIEYSNDKEKLLMGNIEAFKKQISALEEKNKMYACTVAKHEQSIAVLRDEAMSAQQQLARSEVTVSLLKDERDLLKSAEKHLMAERDSLVSEKRSQSLLHVNLESIKLNLERGESETRTRLQNSVTSLEHQIELLRKKLDGEEQRYKETVQSFEERLEREKSLLAMSEEKVRELEDRLSRVPSSGSIVQMTDDETVRALRDQLMESKTELATVRSQLELNRQQVDQYREIANRMEEELKRNNEASVMFREETERKVNELNEEKENLMKKLEEADEKFKKLETASEKLDETDQLTGQVANLTSQVELLTGRLKSAEESEQRARLDFYEQSKQAKEAQDRYERELVQHAADIEHLNRTRDRIDSTLDELNALKQSRAQVEQELESGKKSWTDQKAMLEKELDEKSTRCNELEKQVDLTQQQMVSLSARMAALTKVNETRVKSDDVNASLEEERTSDQLLELVRFLRREKEIAISRSEVQEAENERVRTRLLAAEKQLAEAQRQSDAERERLAASSLTFEKHTDMLRRLETLNALTDSNRLLREDKANVTARLDELTVKCRHLEAELEPLKSSSRETGARVDELTNENAALRKQVVVWKSRVNALQERAGSANETKRLQLERDGLHKQIEALNKQIDANKEAISKSNSEAARLQDESAKLKEEIDKLKVAAREGEAKKAEESAKSIEQANQLRRIARKYKTQYEESKAELDKLKESGPAEVPVDAAKVEELEQKAAQLTAEVDAVRAENAALKANDEKTKNVLKTTRQKLAAFNALTKEKEALAVQLGEARAKIETLELANEEVNVRSAALKSQLEGRLARLERENGELVQLRQSLEAQVDGLDQRLAAAQRQLDAHQKSGPPKAAVVAEVAETPTANVKPIPAETPTAEIKPMAGQVKSTPRASIRPMAATRTAAVQPMAVVVAVVAEPSSEPSSGEPVAVPSTEPSGGELVAGPSTEPSGGEPVAGLSNEPVVGPSTEPSSGEPRQQKRSRDETEPTEEDEEEQVKRTRVNQDHEEEEEEGEVLELMDGPEEGADEYVDEGQEAHEEGDDVEDEAEEVDNVESEPMNEEEGEVVEVEEEAGETIADEEQQQQQPEEVNEPVVEEVEDQPPPPPEVEAEEAAHQVPQEPTPTPAVVILPPPREELLPPRPAMAYDDGGDDGIVPSTPVLLPPRASDGFAEAVSSPHVTTRFVFGSVVEAPAAASHLESQGMEDTRMDLSQLDENRAPPVADETPAPSGDEPADLEGGPDLEGDAAAEMDLLREDEGLVQVAQPESRVEPETPAVSLPAPPVQRTQSPRGGGTARRASPRGRGGMSNRPPGPSRPVPITWTPTGQSNVANNPRVFRRAATTSPAGSVGLLPDPVVGSPSPMRVRGAAAAGRGRARRAARRP